MAQETIERFVEALALAGEPVPIEMNPDPIAPAPQGAQRGWVSVATQRLTFAVRSRKAPHR